MDGGSSGATTPTGKTGAISMAAAATATTNATEEESEAPERDSTWVLKGEHADDYFFCVIDRVRKGSLDVLWLYSPGEARDFLNKPSLEFSNRELLLSIHRDTVPLESLVQPIEVLFCHDPYEAPFPVSSLKASRKSRARFGKGDWQDPARPFVCYRLIDTGHKKTIYRFEHGGYTPEVTKILKRLLYKVKGDPPRSVSPTGRRSRKKSRGGIEVNEEPLTVTTNSEGKENTESRNSSRKRRKLDYGRAHSEEITTDSTIGTQSAAAKNTENSDKLVESPSIVFHKRPRLKTKADRIKLSHHMKVLRANGMDVNDSDLAPGQFVFQFAFKDASKQPNDPGPSVNEGIDPVLELGGPKGQEVLKFNGVNALGSQVASAQGRSSKQKQHHAEKNQTRDEANAKNTTAVSENIGNGGVRSGGRAQAAPRATKTAAANAAPAAVTPKAQKTILPQSMVISQLKDMVVSRDNCLTGDILRKVASFITNYKDLISFRAVAVDWRKTANDPLLWIGHLPFPSLKLEFEANSKEPKAVDFNESTLNQTAVVTRMLGSLPQSYEFVSAILAKVIPLHPKIVWPRGAGKESWYQLCKPLSVSLERIFARAKSRESLTVRRLYHRIDVHNSPTHPQPQDLCCSGKVVTTILGFLCSVLRSSKLSRTSKQDVYHFLEMLMDGLRDHVKDVKFSYTEVASIAELFIFLPRSPFVPSTLSRDTWMRYLLTCSGWSDIVTRICEVVSSTENIESLIQLWTEVGNCGRVLEGTAMNPKDEARCDENTMKCLETLLKCIEDPFLHTKLSKMHGFNPTTEKFYLDDKKRIPEQEVIHCTNKLLIKRKHYDFLETGLKVYIRNAKERPANVNPDVFVRMLQLAAYIHYLGLIQDKQFLDNIAELCEMVIMEKAPLAMQDRRPLHYFILAATGNRRHRERSAQSLHLLIKDIRNGSLPYIVRDSAVRGLFEKLSDFSPQHEANLPWKSLQSILPVMTSIGSAEKMREWLAICPDYAFRRIIGNSLEGDDIRIVHSAYKCCFEVAPWQYERLCSEDRRNQEISRFLKFTVEYLNRSFPSESDESQYSRPNGCSPATLFARGKNTRSLGVTEKDLPTKEILTESILNVISEIHGPKAVYCSISYMLAFLNGMASNMDEKCQKAVAKSIATVSECSEWAEPIPELVISFRSLRQNIEHVLIELATSDEAVQAGLKAISALRDYIQLSND